MDLPRIFVVHALVHAPLGRAALRTALGWLLLTCLGAAPAAAELNISITNPRVDSVAEGDPLQVTVLVLSPPAEITSIQAAVGTRTLALTQNRVNTWSGALSLAGLPRGSHQLVVTAANTAAETREATRSFLYDEAPTLTVTAPAASARVSGPDVRVTELCGRWAVV